MRISNNARPRGLDAPRIADREGVNTSARGRGSANKTRASSTGGGMEHNQRLEIVPCTISDANEFVRQYHRHHAPTQGGLFAVAAAHGEQVVAVAIIGRPVGRRNDDGWTAEVTRLASNGHKNACSILYAAAWRAARALGYQRLITFTLPEEGGASPRAAGLKCIGQTKGDTWNRPNSNRPRVDLHPNQIKLKWEVSK